MSTHLSEVPTALQDRLSWQSVAAIIDHSLVRPETTQDQVITFCEQAVHYHFSCVFLNAIYAPLAVDILRGTAVKVGVPISLPLGAVSTSVKRYEALDALRIGARELDMVINIGALKSGDRQRVQSDIRGVVEIAQGTGAEVKVILETYLLTLEEKILACELSVAGGADFVKTSTSFARGGATVEDVTLMRGVVGDRAGVKASGGIRTAADALAMIHAGATRIGTSRGVSIVCELGASPQFT